MNRYYPNLFQPLIIKNTIYKNRIEASPMGVIPTHHFHSSYPDYGGVSLYDKSIGGVGAIHIVSHSTTNSHSYISNGADPFEKYQLDITQEQMSVGKQNGAVTSICIGARAMIDGAMVGPSTLEKHGKKLLELPIDMIDYIIDDLSTKAKKAKEFGFDAIMLDIAHDSLVAQFMAPTYNRRTDQYGGTYQNRFRFASELLKSVRQAVGEDFIIELRVSAVLHIEGSYEFKEMFEFIKDNERIIDIVNISSGMDEVIEGNVHAVAMLFQPHMKNVDYAKKIKEDCQVYVSVGGSIMTPEEAESIIAEGKADFVMLGRPLLADPYWPLKAKGGRSQDITPCLRCNYCYHISTQHFQTVCSVNPRLYREKRVPLVLDKVKTPKRIAVIGGGPAGCKVALIACQKGHQVDLYEKTNQLGGQLKVADYGGIHKVDLKRYKDYLETQVLCSDIQLFLNTNITKQQLKTMNYDKIIIAIGAEPIIPNINGVDNKKVFNCLDAFENINSLGKKIVIIGGGSIGTELAIQLSEMNKKVVIIEMADHLAGNANLLYKASMKEILNQNPDLNIHLHSFVTEISDNKVYVLNEDKQESSFDFDNVIIAVGMKSKIEEAFDYYNIVDDTYIIGDCKKVAKVLEATNEAYFIASNL